MLNGVYTYAIDHPELCPDCTTDTERGTSAMKNVVGATLGLDIDFYVIVDLAGFEGIIDALGGIQINVTERVAIGGNADDPSAPIEGYIEPGVQVAERAPGAVVLAVAHGHQRLRPDVASTLRARRDPQPG